MSCSWIKLVMIKKLHSGVSTYTMACYYQYIVRIIHCFRSPPWFWQHSLTPSIIVHRRTSLRNYNSMLAYFILKVPPEIYIQWDYHDILLSIVTKTSRKNKNDKNNYQIFYSPSLCFNSSLFFVFKRVQRV